MLLINNHTMTNKFATLPSVINQLHVMIVPKKLTTGLLESNIPTLENGSVLNQKIPIPYDAKKVVNVSIPATAKYSKVDIDFLRRRTRAIAGTKW